MIPEEHIKLICEYEWLRELADDLDVMSIAVDQCLVDLEHRLPDYYEYRGNIRSKMNSDRCSRRDGTDEG